MNWQQACELPYYGGSDLGANPAAEETVFKLWAPTACGFVVCLYATGTDAEPGAGERGVHELHREADGVWFVSPQYNASFPGHVKNLVDWLSRPLPGKGRDSAATNGMRATVSGAGGRTATAEMRAALDSLLEFVGVQVMREGETGVALSGESWASGKLALSAEDEATLSAQADAFLEFIA